MADYIERQAALRAVNEFFHDPKVDVALYDVPASNVREDVQGEWKFCGSDRWNDCYTCSVCGKMNMDNSNFCPNCGARMAGGEKQ